MAVQLGVIIIIIIMNYCFADLVKVDDLRLCEEDLR
jgi:hypothetical protein